MVSRRRFLALLGASAAVTPFLALETTQTAPGPLSENTALTTTPAAEKGLKTPLLKGTVTNRMSLIPLTEGVPPEPLDVLVEKAPSQTVSFPRYGTIPVTPKWYICPPGQPTRDDPLGQFGIVGMKYWMGDKQYGDWIKISEWEVDEMNALMVETAKEALIEYETMKLRLIEPNAYFVL